jgi:hypothetical protein
MIDIDLPIQKIDKSFFSICQLILIKGTVPLLYNYPINTVIFDEIMKKGTVPFIMIPVSTAKLMMRFRT